MLTGDFGPPVFLANEISKNTFVNIMEQYYPVHKAFDYPELSRRITAGEYREAIKAAERAGLTRSYTK